MNNIEGQKPLIELEKFVGQGGVDFAVRQSANAFCEEGLGQKINVTPYGMIRRNGFIYDTEFGSKIRLNPEVEFGEQEIEGMENMFRLIEKGCDLVYWISPAGGSYGNARLVTAIRKESTEGVKVECRGIVINKTPNDLMQIAMNIVCFENGIMQSWVDDPGGLRSQPVGIELNGRDWIDFSKKIFGGMSDVWEAIRKGRDVELRDEIETHVRSAYDQVIKLGLTGRKLDEAFEEGMVARGYRLNPIGNHGGSALNPSYKAETFNSIYSEGGKTKIDSFGNVQHYCSFCHFWYTGDRCPLCG